MVAALSIGFCSYCYCFSRGCQMIGQHFDHQTEHGCNFASYSHGTDDSFPTLGLVAPIH